MLENWNDSMCEYVILQHVAVGSSVKLLSATVDAGPQLHSR